MADLLALLQTARLVTLSARPGLAKAGWPWKWPPGYARFADGVAFIPLADVAAAGDVPYAVLRGPHALGRHQSVEAAIEAYLAPRRLLLVSDNCEHVLESTPLFTDWLAGRPT